MTIPLSEAVRQLLQSEQLGIDVRVMVARGSTPREPGTTMLVTHDAIVGTIGGGRLEWEAVRCAREMLGSGELTGQLEMPLGPSMGQCCGGQVELLLTRVGRATLERIQAEELAEVESRPQVLLFGAGHVGKALASALAPLPLRMRWIDGRQQMFPTRLPASIEIVRSGNLVSEVQRADRGASYLVLTHSHALDFEVCAAALERADFGYLGLIGSATKRAKFERGLLKLGIDHGRLGRLVCPIGGTAVRDKRPAVIAALAAAELITALAARQASAPPRLAATE
jgi:xanthine dehydrogenase accessory protein XdhC